MIIKPKAARAISICAVGIFAWTNTATAQSYVEPGDAVDNARGGTGIGAAHENSDLVLGAATTNFAAGVPLDGLYVITVARDGGGVERYGAADDVTVFPQSDSLARNGGVITLNGAVTFTVAGGARMEEGVITLTRKAQDES